MHIGLGIFWHTTIYLFSILNMKKFLLKTFIFVLPYAILFAFLGKVLFSSGELDSIEKIIDFQIANKSVLYGPAYTVSCPTYKLKSIIKRKPEIIALGSSRVMQFRDKFFTLSPDKFYNAGRGANKIKDFKDFLEKIPEEKLPKVVIMGLDPYFFNSNWDEVSEDDSVLIHIKQKGNNPIFLINSTSFIRDTVRGKTLTKVDYEGLDPGLKKYIPKGYNAKNNGNGFRNDGSYCYGKYFSNPEDSDDWGFKETFKRIKDGNRRFEYSEKVSAKAIKELEEFLKFCQEREIYVIGFLPPYASKVYNKMKSMKEYGYLDNIFKELNRAFKMYKYPLYDFLDINSFGSNDNEVIDGFHGSEVSYLRLFVLMVEPEPILQKYTDSEKLKQYLKRTTSPYLVFEI